LTRKAGSPFLFFVSYFYFLFCIIIIIFVVVFYFLFVNMCIRCFIFCCFIIFKYFMFFTLSSTAAACALGSAWAWSIRGGDGSASCWGSFCFVYFYCFILHYYYSFVFYFLFVNMCIRCFILCWYIIFKYFMFFFTVSSTVAACALGSAWAWAIRGGAGLASCRGSFFFVLFISIVLFCIIIIIFVFFFKKCVNIFICCFICVVLLFLYYICFTLSSAAVARAVGADFALALLLGVASAGRVLPKRWEMRDGV